MNQSAETKVFDRKISLVYWPGCNEIAPARRLVTHPMAPAVLLCLGHFAPPTVAHLRSFERARDFVHLALGLRVVEGILAPLPGESYGLSIKHRLRMVEAAVRRSNWLRLGSWQCSQSSSTPRPITVIFHYVTEVRRKYGENTQLFLLCGDNRLVEMGNESPSWTQAELDSLLSHHGLLVVKRGSSPLGDFIYRHEVFRQNQKNIHIIEDETFPNYLSSDRVRTALRRGESVRYCVDDDVLEYIQDLHLFDVSKEETNGPPPTPPSPPRVSHPLAWTTPPPSETSTQDSNDGQMPSISGTTSLVPPLLSEKQLFEMIENVPAPSLDSPLLLTPLPPIENVVQLEQLVEKVPGKEHCSAIITLSSSKQKKEKKKKIKPPPLPAPLSPNYDNVTLEELLEASTSWAEFMGKELSKKPTSPSARRLPAAPPPPIPPRNEPPLPLPPSTEKRSWFCNRKQEEDLVGICSTDRRKLGQLSPEIAARWSKFEEESSPHKPRKTSSARMIEHFRPHSPPCPMMTQSLHEGGGGVTLTFRRYHLAPTAPETTV